MCASGCADVRRPRYIWYSEPVIMTKESRLVDREGFRELHLESATPSEAMWLEPGWERLSDCSQPFATFIQSKERKRPPPDPAGIHSASEIAKQRWQRDSFRYPSYQYEDCNGVFDSNQVWRPLNHKERLARMGFPLTHLQGCIAKNERLSERHEEDLKASLVGNSFFVPHYAWLMGQT